MMPQSVNAELVDCGVPGSREIETRSYFDFVGPSTHVGRVSAGLSSPTLTSQVPFLPVCMCVYIHNLAIVQDSVQPLSVELFHLEKWYR